MLEIQFVIRNLSVVQLEAAATVGVIVILTVLGIIVQTSMHAGLPAIKSGQLPLWTFQVGLVSYTSFCNKPVRCQLPAGYMTCTIWHQGHDIASPVIRLDNHDIAQCFNQFPCCGIPELEGTHFFFCE